MSGRHGNPIEIQQFLAAVRQRRGEPTQSNDAGTLLLSKPRRAPDLSNRPFSFVEHPLSRHWNGNRPASHRLAAERAQSCNRRHRRWYPIALDAGQQPPRHMPQERHPANNIATITRVNDEGKGIFARQSKWNHCRENITQNKIEHLHTLEMLPYFLAAAPAELQLRHLSNFATALDDLKFGSNHSADIFEVFAKASVLGYGVISKALPLATSGVALDL